MSDTAVDQLSQVASSLDLADNPAASKTTSSPSSQTPCTSSSTPATATEQATKSSKKPRKARILLTGPPEGEMNSLSFHSLPRTNLSAS